VDVNAMKKRKGLGSIEVLALNPVLPILQDSAGIFSAWRELCYKESCLEEVEEALLRRIAGQCSLKLRAKPYHTGTRYLQHILEPKVRVKPLTSSFNTTFESNTELSSFAEKSTQYTAETLFQKSKRNTDYYRSYHLKGNTKLQEINGYYETSANYTTFKRKYNAIMGAQTYASSVGVMPLIKSKVIPPLTLWSENWSVGGKMTHREDEVFSDICIRSHALTWSTNVAQEFTMVEDPSTVASMPTVTSAGALDLMDSPSGGVQTAPNSPVGRPLSLRRGVSGSIGGGESAKRRASDPLSMYVLAPEFRELVEYVRVDYIYIIGYAR
jgi:hypothetical protein